MLKLVSSSVTDFSSSFEKNELLAHHESLLESYLQSHRIRNHSPKTIAREKAILTGWFASHSSDSNLLYTWEAMKPIEGRKRIVDYGAVLLERGISSETIRYYIGILNRYFSYVLQHPFVQTSQGYRRIQDLYGHIEHPISHYDMPHHPYDGERLGVPLDPERLFEFYAHLRQHYLEAGNSYKAIRARNYTMLVVAGESGLRIQELIHLEISQDLFFESMKLQTRLGKATHGSGPRPRLTLLTPLARDTIQFYIKKHRLNLLHASQTDLLFPSKEGMLMTYSSAHAALQEMTELARNTQFPVALHMSWHWTRRLFATRFIERFPDQLAALIHLLGHQNYSTLHRYIKHSEPWMNQQIQSLLERTTLCPHNGN